MSEKLNKNNNFGRENKILTSEWEMVTKNNEGEPEVTTLHRYEYQGDLETAKELLIPPEKELKFRKRKIGKATLNACKTYFIFSDSHIGWRNVNGLFVPTHDPRSLELAKEIAYDIQPDYVMNLGDTLDLAEISRYDQDSNHFLGMTQQAIDTAYDFEKGMRESTPNARFIELQGNHDCLDKDTEILSNMGWKKYYEVRDGEKIASYNINTNTINFAAPLARIVKDFDGELNYLENGYLNMALTDNHRVVYSRKNNQQYSIDHFSDLPNSTTQLYVPVCGLNHNSDYDMSDDLIRLLGWTLTDCHLSPRRNSVVYYQRLSNHHKIQEVLDRLKIDYYKKIRERDIKEICGKKLKEKCESSVELSVHAKDSRFIKTLLEKNYKKIPEYVKQFSKRQFDIFLDTVVEADGNRKNNAFTIYKHKEFLDDLQALCSLNEYRTLLREYKPGNFRLSVSSNSKNRSTSTSEFKKKPYKGKVWCFTTIDSTMVVRRNGVVFVTGNCRFMSKVGKAAASLMGLKRAGTNGASLFSYEDVMNLKSLDIEYMSGYPNSTFMSESGEMQFRHGPDLRSNGSTAELLSKRYPYHGVIQGHGHKSQTHHRTRPDGKDMIYHMTPILGRTDGVIPGYNTSVNDRNEPTKIQEDWQSGISIYQEYPNGASEIRSIEFKDGVAFIDGKKYEARFDIEH